MIFLNAFTPEIGGIIRRKKNAILCFMALFFELINMHLEKRIIFHTGLFVLRFYGPVNPMGSCRARSVYLTTRLLGRLSPLSG